jgi:hypothetical protein
MLVRIWAYESLGQLVRGKLQCGPQGQNRNSLVLGARRNGSRQQARERRHKRQPDFERHSHSRLLIAGQPTRPREPLYRVASDIGCGGREKTRKLKFMKPSVLANGLQQVQATNPTAGLHVKF